VTRVSWPEFAASRPIYDNILHTPPPPLTCFRRASLPCLHDTLSLNFVILHCGLTFFLFLSRPRLVDLFISQYGLVHRDVVFPVPSGFIEFETHGIHLDLSLSLCASCLMLFRALASSRTSLVKCDNRDLNEPGWPKRWLYSGTGNAG